MVKSKKKYVKPVGRGVSKDAFEKSKTKDMITTFKINKAAWKAFWQSEDGQQRLARMAKLNTQRMARYKTIADGGGFPAQTDADVYSNWRENIA